MSIPHIVYPSSTDEQLGCFHFWAVVKNAAMNVVRQIFVQVSTFDSSGHMPRSGIARSHGKSIFTFLRSCHPISTAAAPFYIPLSDAQGSCISTHLPTLVIF